MKRRNLIGLLCVPVVSAIISGCSKLGFSTGSSSTTEAKKIPPNPEGAPSRRKPRRASASITDLKTLSKLLQQARCPLTDMQVEYLLTLREETEFTQKMMDILDDTQKEVIKTLREAGEGDGDNGIISLFHLVPGNTCDNSYCF